MLYVFEMTSKYRDSSRDVPDSEGGRVTVQGHSSWSETARDQVGLNSELAMVEGMRDEARRLMTYTNWPSSFQDPAKLAEVGLFYTGRLDRVKCAFCLGVLKEWQLGDVPLTEHQRHFPYCRFLKGEDVGNIPARRCAAPQMLGGSGLRPAVLGVPDWNKGCDTSMNENMCITPSCVPPPSDYINRLRPSDKEANPIPSSTTQVKRNCSDDETGAPSVPTAARTLDYTSEASRLATFRHWPTDSPISPVDLARAGFYHAPAAGKPDRVKCGYCQGKLYAWSGGEDPEMEHRQCFPTCPFLGMNGGARRTNQVLTASSPASFFEGNIPTSVPARLNLSSKKSLNTTTRDMVTANQAGFWERMRARGDAVFKQDMDDPEVFMLSDTVTRVLEMGFARETIERLVRNRRKSCVDLASVEGLVEAVFNNDV
ncbi:baculoviral IAP repeat-containing protein 2-like [Haliotis cracherodii]|uniref:baculoviral IAP repeat-containing protein 2-like n=1 Tax=Haliotis cracherodii TaxID=6455 RepID=UPI0039E86603